jgi:hypothetical protein
MKGKIIRMLVYRGVMDFAHGQGFYQKRLLIPERENLVIWHHQGVPYARHLAEDTTDYEVVGEVEVPREVVERVLSLKHLSATLTSELQTLIGE